MNRFSKVFVLALALCTAAKVFAGSFDVLPIPNGYVSGLANCLSKDGSVVAGAITDNLGGPHLAYWTIDGNLSWSSPYLGLSGDGGQYDLVSGNGAVMLAIDGKTPVYATHSSLNPPSGSVSVMLGSVSNGFLEFSDGEGLSQDGSTLVGQYPVGSSAVSYNLNNSSHRYLQLLSPGSFEQARACSRDGSVVIGDSVDVNYVDWPEYWDLAGVHQAPILAGSTGGRLSATNSFGSVLAGAQYLNSGNAWHLTATADRKTLDLGVAPGMGTPGVIAISDDANTMIGMQGSEPFVWTSKEGFVDSATFLNEHGVSVAGYRILSLTGMSSNGMELCGECAASAAGSPPQGFVATIDKWAGVLLSNVVLETNSIVGGNGMSGTITLTAPATFPVNVVFANFPGSGPLVHALVTVPAGQNSANFTLNTEGVATATKLSVQILSPGSSLSRAVTLNPATISTFSLSPPAVVGGLHSVAQISLNGKAAMAGETASVSASNPSVAFVPATVALAPGAAAFSFNIATNLVSATSSSLISVIVNGVSQSRTLTVNPNTMSLYLAAYTVRGGSAQSGTVSFNVATPVSQTISLSSSDPNVAAVPSTVTMGVGDHTVVFSIVTSAVAVDTKVKITAQFGSLVQSVYLTVTP